MAKRKHREEQELPFVALMDTMTNVVGVLIIVLVMVGISIANAVKNILSDLPPVTPEEHRKMLEIVKELPPPPADPKKLEEDKKIAEQKLQKAVRETPTKFALTRGTEVPEFLRRLVAHFMELCRLGHPLPIAHPA